MRTKAIALATATGALLGCGKESDYRWGSPYQPGIGADEDEDEDPPDDDDGPPATSEEAGSDGESGLGTTSGADPSLTDAVADTSGSTGEPQDTGESPYQGGWDVGSCQDEMLGDVADFHLTDSYGDQIRLYDFCHKAILLTAGSFW